MSGTHVRSARLDPEPVAHVASRTSAEPSAGVPRCVVRPAAGGQPRGERAVGVRTAPEPLVLRIRRSSAGGDRGGGAPRRSDCRDAADRGGRPGQRTRRRRRARGTEGGIRRLLASRRRIPDQTRRRPVASTRAGGVPLPHADRARLEPVFRARSRRSADPYRCGGSSGGGRRSSVGARAFTRGADVYFGAGHFQPGTSAGRGADRPRSGSRGSAGAARGSFSGRPRRSAWYEEAGEWALGAIGGEWMDEQSFGQIGVDFVLECRPRGRPGGRRPRSHGPRLPARLQG